MAVAISVTNVHSEGNLKGVHGTFTTASGDTTVTLDNSVHGLNYIVNYNVSLDTGGIGVQQPKVLISSGTLTATFDDTKGYSGKFYVLGR